uniref:Protein Nef n=1 Tax=Human immunodeficiency virus type 1 TaxID=11676 RepID=A0A159CA90_HV1|nr:nef protein [Human immunodeficiency virus 1]
MGNKWSKSWPAVRERMQRARAQPATEGRASRAGASRVEPAAAEDGASGISRPGTSSNQAQDEDEEVGFPVRPQVPLRPMTYKGAFDLSFFLKEKGGLDGIIYSPQRQEILDLWVYHTQGYFPDWQNYTPGPGIRYPLTFGWCFKLVPVEAEEATAGERDTLLSSISQHGTDNPEGEVLMWKFDSSLARLHKAREIHPEYYKNC